MTSSIRTRLLVLMMAVLLPAMAAGLYIVASTYAGQRTLLERSLTDSARAVAQVIDRELVRRIDLARVMASSDDLVGREVAELDRQQLHAWASDLVKPLGGWVSLHSATQVLLDTRLPADSPPQPLPASNFSLAEVALVRPLARSGPGGPLHAQVVQPLRLQGELLNLVIAVPPAAMQAVIDAQQMQDAWIGTVIDSAHQVVARQPGGGDYAGRLVFEELQQRLRTENETVLPSVTLDGVEVLSVFSKTSQGWAFLAAAPRPPLTSGVPEPLLLVAAGAVLLLAAAAGGALWLGRGIARAAESLKDAAVKLQNGHAVALGRTGIAEFDEVGTTLRSAASALGNARHDLERQVADAVSRTRLAEQRSSQGQRIAALGRLTGGVAHDFNNLLGVISNSAHLIERHAKTPALQLPVAATLRAVEVGSRLSQQLLRFGARQPVSPRTVDLAGYLPELRDLLQMVVRKNIPVSIEVQSGTEPVQVDVGELELALINLALNARDAMPDGGALWLQARNAAPDEVEGLSSGRYVLVAMTDSGVGVDEATAAHVFEPFYTTKAVGQGTGLGLSQVHGFCVQAGGTARMASTPGVGSTVTLLLPACAAEGAQGPAATPVPAPTLPLGADALAGVRLLLVEDNEELADMTVMLLLSYGCNVRRAHNVADALAQYAADDSVQLVLSDVVMPGGRDGVDLARELRRRRPDLPIVLISGYSASLAGVTEFPVLRKPVSADVLVRTLVSTMRGEAPSA